MPRPSDTAKGNQAVGGLVYRGQLGPDVDCQIGLFMMEVEEEKAVVIDSLAETQLVIPETARGVFSRLSKDSREGWALMQCVLKNGGMDGRPIWREKYIGSRGQMASLKSSQDSSD